MGRTMNQNTGRSWVDKPSKRIKELYEKLRSGWPSEPYFSMACWATALEEYLDEQHAKKESV